jgi:hypothetical protein
MPHHRVVSAPVPTRSNQAHSPSNPVNHTSNTGATINISNTKGKDKVMATLNMAHNPGMDNMHKAAMVRAMDKVATMQHMVYHQFLGSPASLTNIVPKVNNILAMHSSPKQRSNQCKYPQSRSDLLTDRWVQQQLER